MKLLPLGVQVGSYHFLTLHQELPRSDPRILGPEWEKMIAESANVKHKMTCPT